MKIKILFSFLVSVMLLSLTASCGKDEAVPPSEQNGGQNGQDDQGGGDDNQDDSTAPIIVTVDADGNADGGHRFVKIDDTNFYIDDIKYTATKGNLSVTGYNDAFFTGEARIISTLKYDGRTLKVVSISEGAFSKCEPLTSIYIPNTIKEIGTGAFINCPNLTKAEFASIVDLCQISFSKRSNPLSIAHHLYVNGEEVRNLNIPNEITSIKPYTFIGASYITSITFHDKVKNIGEYAFQDCYGITSLALPEGLESLGVYAFLSCKGLKTINIPRSLATIGRGAFSSCVSISSIHIKDLQTWINNLNDIEDVLSGATYRLYLNGDEVKVITIPDGYDYIRDNAFSGCQSIEELILPSSVVRLGISSFEGCCGLRSINLSAVKYIDNSAFKGCSGLTSVVIPPSLLGIGSAVFRNCENLKSVTINNNEISSKDTNYSYPMKSRLEEIFGPQVQEYKWGDDVIVIGRYTCYGLTELKSIILGNNLKKIGSGAFNICEGISSINIPSNVESIQDYAFSHCTGVNSITVDEGNTQYDSRSSCNAVIDSKSNKLILGCRRTIIPDDVTSIGYNSYINSGDIITIPEGVKTIHLSAFSSCNDLKTVYIPASVTDIGYYIFPGCINLSDVYCYAEMPPNRYSLDTELLVFDGEGFINDELSVIKKATLHVPATSVERYKAIEPWNKYGRIVAIQ